GHHVDHVEIPPLPSSFVTDFVLYWALLATGQIRVSRGEVGDAFDRTRLDNLTLGLDRHARRNLHRLPLAIMRLRGVRRRMARFARSYDAVLTPTVADETPRIGHLDPTADYQQIMDRLADWVAFTPVQNVTGEPAISLPLAESANGLPVGMMLAADLGQEARLLELGYELEEARPWARIQARVADA
ncbi:MAG: amidase family protein, partial [Mycobacterium sp.]